MSGMWLPELMLLDDSNGDWPAYLDRLHRQFAADFVDSSPHWPGKRVGLKRHPEHDGKSATFWHMISEGKSEADRTPDFRRCERIAWPRPMMDEFDAASPGTTECRLIWWKETRGREERYLLSTKEFDYVVVVADRGNFVLPWTAFVVEHEHQRRKRRQAYEAFWKAKKAEAAPKDGLVTPSTHG